MTYTANPNREVKNGIAKVSAKELADFKAQHGADKDLTDLLNMDKGLTRRVPKAGSKTEPKAEPKAEPKDFLPSRGTMASQGYKIRPPGSTDTAVNHPEYPEDAQPMKKGGKVSSASSRADGCAQRGKTKGRYL